MKMRSVRLNCGSIRHGADTTRTPWSSRWSTMPSSLPSTAHGPRPATASERRLHGANGPFRSSTRETPEMHVRFLAPDVAVMHSRFHIYGDVDESERTSIGTRVVRKVDGRWRTVAVQNTDVRPGRRH